VEVAVKDQQWWSPNGTGADAERGTLLSYRWVQTFVFELPQLKRAELEASLRYKVQATLPVNAADFIFHTHVFRHGKKMYGAAFMATAAARDVLPRPARTLRVASPLLLPRMSAAKVLLFVSTPEGLGASYYEDGLFKNSFAPIDLDDLDLRARILERCPGAEIVGLAPEPQYPLPDDLKDRAPPDTLASKIVDAFPYWEPAPPRLLPRLMGVVLLGVGLAFCAYGLWSSWSVRNMRNELWKNWLKKNESLLNAPTSQQQTASLLKVQGAPVPELFEHLARIWGDETRIVELEWSHGKIALTAVCPSALASLRKLTADPWFRNMRVDDIRTQKDGTELFTVEGNLVLDE
jgi:hypothetical protein